MNNGLTESENALNCIIENYINELQRNTCDDDEEDMRIYQEKMDYITILKEIVLKNLEALEIIKKYGYKKVFELEEVKDGGYIFNAEDIEFITKEDFKLLKEVLENDK